MQKYLKFLKNFTALHVEANSDLKPHEKLPNSRAHKQLKLRRELQLRQTADFYYLIDIVGSCNLKCPSCPVGNYEEQPTKGLMSLETYKRILHKISIEHPGEKIFVDI